MVVLIVVAGPGGALLLLYLISLPYVRACDVNGEKYFFESRRHFWTPSIFNK